MTHRRLFGWVAAASALLVAALLAHLAVGVDSSRDLVLLRNAIIADLGPPAAYRWTPEQTPPDYRTESLPAPEPLVRFATRTSEEARPAGDFETALALAGALVRNKINNRGAIQSDTLTALERITSDGAGYCADYTQVFSAVGHAAGLFVREWGMSFDGYGGDGHAFNEVWDRQRNEWLFVDSFFSFYVTDAAGEPVSATELRAALLNGSADTLRVVPIQAEQFGFKSPAKALDYYARGAPRFYMVWGNDVLSYDRDPAVRFFSRFSRSAEQIAGIASGAQPGLVIPSDLADDDALRELSRLRMLLALLGISAVLTCVATLLWRWMRT